MMKSNKSNRHVDQKGDDYKEGNEERVDYKEGDRNHFDGNDDEKKEEKSKYMDSCDHIHDDFIHTDHIHDDDARENEYGLNENRPPTIIILGKNRLNLEGRHSNKNNVTIKEDRSSKSSIHSILLSRQSVRGSLPDLQSIEKTALQVAISAHFGVREALGRVRTAANDPSRTVHTNHGDDRHSGDVPHTPQDYAWVFLDDGFTGEKNLYIHDPKCTPCTPLSHVKNRWYDREQRGEYACVVGNRNPEGADARILPEPDDQQSPGGRQDRASDHVVKRIDDESTSTDDATSRLYSIQQQIRIHLIVASYLVPAFVISSAIPGWGHPKSTHVSRILSLVWMYCLIFFSGLVPLSGWDRENLFRRKFIWFNIYKFLAMTFATVVYLYLVFIPKSNEKSRGNCPIVDKILDKGIKSDSTMQDCEPRHHHHREGHPLSEDTSGMLQISVSFATFFYCYFRMARFQLSQDDNESTKDDHDHHDDVTHTTQVDRDDHPDDALQVHKNCDNHGNRPNHRISRCWRDPYGISCITLLVNQFYLNITKFRSVVTHAIWLFVVATGVLAPSYTSRFDVMTLSTHPSAIVQLMRGFLLVLAKQVVAVLVYIAATKLHIPGIRLYLQVQLAASFSVIVPLMVSQSSSFLNVIVLLFFDSLTVFTRVFFATPLFDSSHLTSKRRVSKFLSAFVFCARRWSLYYRIRPPIATPIFPFFMVGLQSENQVTSVGYTVILLLYPCSYLLYTLAPERVVPSELQIEYYHDQDRHLAMLYEFVFPHGSVSFLYVLLGFVVEVLRDYFVRHFYHISFEKKYDCRVIKDVEEYYISDPQKTKGKLDSHSKLTLYIWFSFAPMIIILGMNTASLVQLRKQGVFAP